MRYIITLLLFAISFSSLVYGQEINQVSRDQKSDTDILFGYCDRDGLTGDVFGLYFKEEYRTFEPDIETIKKLRTLPDDWEATLVLGSWCSDSQREVPRFYRILDEAGIDSDKIEIIAVDRKKEAGSINLDDLDIQRVPTIIFFKNGKEIGRIVEVPNTTLANDMLLILARPAKPASPGDPRG